MNPIDYGTKEEEEIINELIFDQEYKERHEQRLKEHRKSIPVCNEASRKGECAFAIESNCHHPDHNKVVQYEFSFVMHTDTIIYSENKKVTDTMYGGYAKHQGFHGILSFNANAISNKEEAIQEFKRYFSSLFQYIDKGFHQYSLNVKKVTV